MRPAAFQANAIVMVGVVWNGGLRVVVVWLGEGVELDRREIPRLRDIGGSRDCPYASTFSSPR